MSNKFEQLLDYLVNEEMDKANELFHEIVVEKSRDIYENLIAEEAEEDEEMDEAASCDDEEEMGESAEELEDSYMMDADDDVEGDAEFGGDATDDMLGDVEVDDEEGNDEFGGDEEGSESDAIFDIKNAIADLEAAFAELEASHGAEGDDEFGVDDEFGDEEDGEEFSDDDFGDEEDGETDEMMGMYEGRRVTREYVEKVGNDWEKNSQKTQGQIVGANTGEKMPGSNEGRSPVSSGKGKPTTGATAANILGDTKAGAGTNTGTSPAKHQKGINPESGEKFAKGIHNVDGAKSGVKTLTKVAGGHGAEKKGAGPGPVGSGSGDKAGQTSIAPETKKQFLPQHTK